MPVEVECRNLDEVAAALAAGAARLLLDNMDLGRCAAPSRPATRTGAGKGPVPGGVRGVDLETVAAIAATGVDFISVGALTHSAPGADFSLLSSSPRGRPT